MDSPVKRVAILLPSVAVGGAERVVQEELAYLMNDPRLYIELHLVFEKGHLYDKFKEMGIPIFVWNAPHKSPLMLIKYFQIFYYLYREGFDVLHVHLLNFLSSLMGKIFGLKVITTVHVDAEHGFWKRFNLSLCDVLLACGKQVMLNLKKFIPEQKIKLLSNAVRPVQKANIDSDNILSKMKLSPDSKIVLSLGRLTKQKGYDLLITAFEQVVSKTPEAVLLIGGVGTDEERLKRQISEIGMNNHIRLLGLIDNVDELLRICCIYINSSRWEGLPMTLLEAMSHEKPIIATDVGGNRDVIIDGETGLLISSDQPDLMANAMMELLNDNDKACRLAKNALGLVMQEYSIEKHCEILSSEYLA